MNRILFIVLLSFVASTGFSQLPTAIGLYGGAGCATKHNYDVAPSVGFSFAKFVANRTTLGANLFYQTYSLYYDNEANSAKHGSGVAGAIVRHASSYVFVAPKIEFCFGKLNRGGFFINAGAGFKVGGFDSMRKWDHSLLNTSSNYYDSSLDMSKNMNSMLVRVGFGFKQYIQLGDDWHLVIIEDFGMLTSGLSKYDAYSASRTQYTPQKLIPGYISLQIGIFHWKTVMHIPKK